MQTYKIHLIRHGLTDANYDGRYIGSRSDLPLSPQSLEALLALKEDIYYPEVRKLYSSPMLRCRQTGAVLYPDLEITPVDNMREIDFGDFEGKTADMLESNPDYLKWASGTEASPPGGESTTNFTKRICQGLYQIVFDMMQQSITESAVIMHGGAIMMLLSASGVPRRRSLEWTCEPGHGYTILITPSLYHSSGVIEVYEEI